MNTRSPKDSLNIEIPSGPLSLNADNYIPLTSVENMIYQTISQPGGLVRIKGNRKTGKSSLLLRLIKQITNLNYVPIYIDLSQADQSLADSHELFLQWLCTNISHQMQLEPDIEQYWHPHLGVKVSCTNYLEDYILNSQSQPVVLILNHIDDIIHWSHNKEFFSLLRSWYEQAKFNPDFGKLRLILIQGTEIHVKLNITQSPFNVGLSITLPDLTVEQISTLASRYQIQGITLEQIQELMFMVGGHPYLMNSALYYLANHPKHTIEDLLREIASPTGIYREHLLSCWQKLQNSPECLVALRKILKAPNGANIDHATAYKLENCGLIKLQGDRSEIACNLYRQYFSEQNLEDLDLQQELNRLRSENEYLYTLSYQDQLTEIANQRYLDYYLAETWGTLFGKQKPLSIIVLEVDHLKIFNDIHGFPAGDQFLKKVAKILKENTDKNNHMIARSSGNKFMVVLPLTEVQVATGIAENIRTQVQSLQVVYGGGYGGLPQCVSISVGVVGCFPQANMELGQLIQTANQALAKSKFMGGNQLTITDQLLDPKLQIIM